MSAPTTTEGPARAGSDASTGLERLVGANPFRLLSLGGVLVLVASYVGVLTDVTAVVGGTTPMLALVVFMLAAATFVARAIDERTAALVAVLSAAVGFWYYFTAAGLGIGIVLSAADRVVSDTIALATGYSLLRMVEVGAWTLGFAPAPAFLSWYLALRRRYVLAVVPGGVALLFLVLTGDAGIGTTLVGTVGAISAVGFGELGRRDGTLAQADVLAVLFAAIVLLSMTVTIVPAGSGGPLVLVEPDDDTLESSLTSATDRSGIGGRIELSPEVRFTVRSEEPSYWRTGVYDRFTGDEWIRTGGTTAYEERLAGPPGETDTVRQTYVMEDGLEGMPAAPEPVAVEGGAAENTRVTSHGQIRPDESMIEGDVYNVESAVLNDSPENLRGAGTEYPDHVEGRYLQTPEGTSDEFADRTAQVTGDATDPYEKAEAIETYLRASKSYSLNVSRPGGNVAETFLLERDEGYCVYFATAMTQMLREEDVPARYVTGYTTGQQVDDNEWVVRGLNAHAWVEVYFPDEGWVAFDPTPSDPRDDERADRIEDARDSGAGGVDTDRSADEPVTETNTSVDGVDPAIGSTAPVGGLPRGELDGPNSTIPGSETETGTNATTPTEGPDDTAGSPTETEATETEAAANDEGVPLPPLEDAMLGLALLVGVAAGAHRTGVTDRVSREAKLHWHGRRGTPTSDTERAYRRLETLLEREYRPRQAGETPRQYVDALSTRTRSRTIDPRAERVTRLYERAKYGDGVDRAEADEAVAAVDAMVRDRTPILRRFRR